MSVTIRIEASARMRAQVYDPKYVTEQEDIDAIEGEIELPAYPRIGDEIAWPDGRSHTVLRFAWFTDDPTPLVIVGHS